VAPLRRALEAPPARLDARDVADDDGGGLVGDVA
jgi:hypothetical protein